MTASTGDQSGGGGVGDRTRAPLPDLTPSWLGARGFGMGALALSAVLTTVGALWWFVDDRASFMAIGWAAAFAVSLPFVRRGASLQSPWSLLALSVFIGCAVRGTFIAFGVEGPSRSLETLFLLGHPPQYFIGPSLMHLLGLVCLTAGYVGLTALKPRRPTPSPGGGPRPGHNLGPMTPVVVLVFAVVGLVAFVLYVRETGGLTLSSLSAKRATINGLNLSDDYSSHGELRFLNGFGAAAFWLAVAYAGVLRRRGRRVAIAPIVIPVLGLNAVLLPFYMSSRSDAAFILLVAVGIHLAFGGMFSRRVAVGVLAVVVLLLAVMTGLRSSSDRDEPGGSLGDAALEAFVYNRNFGDMQNTSHIVQNVPLVVPFQGGQTMIGYLVAPVPRSVWPDKPIVNTGPLIGVYIYGNARSGVPPGLFGDLYLNFGHAAIPVGGLVTGLLLGGVERWRRNLRLDQQMGLIVYCTVGFRLGLFAMNQGVAFAVFKGAMEVVPVLIVVALSMGRRRREPIVRESMGPRRSTSSAGRGVGAAVRRTERQS